MTKTKETINALVKDALLMSKAAEEADTKELKNKLKAEIKPILVTLRAIESEIHNKEKEKKSELTESEIIGIINSAKKVRVAERDTLVKANRDTSKVDKELETIEKLLPKQLNKEELIARVNEIISKSDIKDNRVIGIVQKELKGQADGGLISQIVKEAINK